MPQRTIEQSLLRTQDESLQYILQKRIGYGQAQNTLALPLYILLFAQGCESIVISLLLPELEREWGISTVQKSFLITAIFFGVGLGSIMQPYADKMGRKVFLKRIAIYQTIFGLLSCIAPSMQFFIMVRFFYAIGIGVAFPLSRKYISQITPAQNRLLLLNRLRTYFTIGCLFTYITGWIVHEHHNWRLLLLIINIPGIYALYEISQNGKQSLKFLWLSNKNEEVYELVKYMTRLNNKQQIKRQEIQLLLSHKKDDIEDMSYKDLLTPQYKQILISLTISWFSVFFIYYGIFLFMPTILTQFTTMSHDYKYLTLCSVVVFQIVCSLLSKPIMEHELFGRKKTLVFSLFMVGMFSLSLMIAQQNDSLNFVVSFICIKTFITLAFMTMYPYTAEICSGQLRRSSKGIFLAAGRVGTILLGFLGINALYWLNDSGLYLIFVVLSIVSAYLIIKLPFENFNRLSNASFFFS